MIWGERRLERGRERENLHYSINHQNCMHNNNNNRQIKLLKVVLDEVA